MTRFNSTLSDRTRAERLDGLAGRKDDRAIRFGEMQTNAFLKPLIAALNKGGLGPSPTMFTGPSAFLKPSAGGYLANGNGVTLGTAAGVANEERISPWLCPWDMSIDQLGLSCSTLLAASQCKVTLYASDAAGRPANLIAETAVIATDTTGTKFSAASVTLKMGSLYWLGVRFSGVQTLRTANAPALAWSNAAPPVPYQCLSRSLAFGTAATAWVFANSQLSATAAPLAMMRIA